MTQSSVWDVVVVGSANTDFMVRGKQLPKPGETTQGEQFLIGQGGKGANQAVAAARLGARVALIARVGKDDRGDALVEQLKREKVETKFIVRDPDEPTGAAVIQVEESGEKQIFMAPNANGKLSLDDVRQADVWQQAHVVVTQLEIPLATVREAMRLAGEIGAKIVLDPAPPIKVPVELLHHVTVIKPNRSEGEHLTGVKISDQASARTAAKKLLKRGVKAVAVQAGDEGNLLVWEDGEVWLPKIPVESVDATGAGDAFIGALAVALSEGKSWAEAGHLANTAAALTTTKMGAQDALPTREQVEKLIAQSQPH